MKNALMLLAFALFFSQCSSLEFEQPLPNGGQEIKTLPRNLVGTYLKAKDSSSIFQEYRRIQFIPKDAAWELSSQIFFLVKDLETCRDAFVRNDSLFAIQSDSSGPQFSFLVKRMGDQYLASPKLRYHVEPSKGRFVLYDEDSGSPTPCALVLRKQEDVYFFNIQALGSKYWQTTTLQLTPQGIRFQYLSSPLGEKADLPFPTRQVVDTATEDNPDTIRVAMPTDLELAKYRSNAGLVNVEDLPRIAEQK
ncbi:MAG: hypothetical protein H7246_07350 [Phycisphaerae bacterium]|nr:hypothetical protein [Saprospiraceae bacterium]